MRFIGSRFEFRMELHSDEVIVIRNLNRFDDVAVVVSAGDLHSMIGDDLTVIVIEFISVTVTFKDPVFTIKRSDQCILAKPMTATCIPRQIPR